MINYIFRRLLQTLVVIILVSFIAFFMIQLIPGDPATTILGYDAGPEAINALRHQLGLDLPLHIQYGRWVSKLFHGDLGNSIIVRDPVTQLIKKRLPITMYLAALALVMSTVLGILAGIFSAVRRGGALDSIITLLANIGIATPSFWLGILGIYLFGLKLGWLPIQGFVWPNEDLVKHLKLIILPSICLSVYSLAVVTRQTRSSMLEVIRQDYIRTAKSKGLQEKTIVIRHAVKNALIPVVTLVGLYLPITIGGSVLVETIFNIPGMGRLLVQAAFDKDFPILQAGILLIGLVVGFANLMVDLSYGWLDPRIRYE